MLRYQGQALTYIPGSACYRCIFPDPPPEGSIPSTSEVGILGSVAGLLGIVEANEAIKYLLAIGSLLNNHLLYIDALSMEIRKDRVDRDAGCPVCGGV